MISITKYVVKEVDDFEEFMFTVVKGLEEHAKVTPDFSYRVDYNEHEIKVKTMRLNESAN